MAVMVMKQEHHEIVLRVLRAGLLIPVPEVDEPDLCSLECGPGEELYS